VPFVRVTVFTPKLSTEQIRRLERETTELMISIMRKPIAGTAVLVEHIHRGDWNIAGKKKTVAAHVEATIGRDTNSPAEKAKFIRGMMALLRASLGPELAEETYVVLHEIDVGSYGGGGLTRAERDQQRSTSL